MDNLCVIILNYNGTQDTLECVESICKYQNTKEVTYFILDNGSTKEKRKKLIEGLSCLLKGDLLITDFQVFKSCKIMPTKHFCLLLSNVNYGFSRGNNECMKIARQQGFDYVLLMNNDTVLVEPSITILMNEIQKHSKYGAMSVVINYYDKPNEVWNAGGSLYLGSRKYYKNSEVYQWVRNNKEIIDVTFLTGCFLIIPSNTIDKVGLLTEKFFFGEEDYEYCLRLRDRGIPIAVTTKTKILHKVGRSISTKNKELQLSKTFVHHLNRFIDMRDYLGVYRWTFWRYLSTIIIFAKVLKPCESLSTAREYILNLTYFSKKYNKVSKRLFEYILQSAVTNREMRNYYKYRSTFDTKQFKIEAQEE